MGPTVWQWRIPKHVASAAKWKRATRLRWSGRFRCREIAKAGEKIDAEGIWSNGIIPENVHAEVDWDEPRGMKHGKRAGVFCRKLANLVWLDFTPQAGREQAGEETGAGASPGIQRENEFWRLFVRLPPR